MSKAQINGAFIAVLVTSVVSLSTWRLTMSDQDTAASGFTNGFGTVLALCFHVFVACGATAVLAKMYLDPVPIEVRYIVMGESLADPVVREFVHSGRWTTFTTWCNTVGAVYFWAAALCSATLIHGGTVPPALLTATTILWEITFPMAFLVNSIVSFVLIPGLKKQNKFDKVWCMLMPTPQLLHNGFAIASALEAMVVSPPLALRDFPVITLYGSAYVVFAYVLFAVTGIYHYYFIDPRFKFAPCGVFGLLVLVTILYLVGSVAITAASHSRVYGAAILLAALATCTFRDATAVRPDGLGQSLQGLA